MRSLAVVALLALGGCASFIDRKAASSTYRILERSMQAAARQTDLQLAREALPGGIIQLEAFSLAYPDHRGFKEMHADALCQYTVAFVFDDWEDATFGGRDDAATQTAERLTGLLAACVDANLALLPPAWRAATQQGNDAVIALLPKLTRAEVPRVLWLGMAGAVQVALAPMASMQNLPRIKATLARITEVAPGFHDADAEILLGTLEAALSPLFKGTDGAPRFATARTLTAERVLSVDVMFARGTLVARKDRAAFTRTLEQVLAADLTRWPEHRLANELARKKARRYLAAVDQLLPSK